MEAVVPILQSHLTIKDVANLYEASKKLASVIESLRDWDALYQERFPYDKTIIPLSGFPKFYTRYTADAFVWGSTKQWEDFMVSDAGINSAKLYSKGDMDVIENSLDDSHWEYLVCRPKKIKRLPYSPRQIGEHYTTSSTTEYFIRFSEMAGRGDLFRLKNALVEGITELGAGAPANKVYRAKALNDWIDEAVNVDFGSWVFDFPNRVIKGWGTVFYVENLGIIEVTNHKMIMNVKQVKQYNVIYFKEGIIDVDMYDGVCIIVFKDEIIALSRGEMPTKFPFRLKSGWIDRVATLDSRGCNGLAIRKIIPFDCCYRLFMDHTVTNLQIYAEQPGEPNTFTYRGFLALAADGRLYFLTAPKFECHKIPYLANVVDIISIDKTGYFALNKDGVVFTGGTASEGKQGMGTDVDIFDVDAIPPTNFTNGTIDYIFENPSQVSREEKKIGDPPCIFIPRQVELPGRVVQLAGNGVLFSAIVVPEYA